jgi:ABC-type nitrate/sulfonate/bicarbonate transport system permease component
MPASEPGIATPAGLTPAGTGPRRPRVPDALLPWIGTALMLAAYQVVGQTGILFDSAYVPGLPDIVDALVKELGDSGFWSALWATLEAWILGFMLGAVVAIPLGIAIGTSPTTYRSVRLLIEFIRPIPAIAVLPLAVLLWGVGLEMKVYIVAFGAFFPLLFQAIYGVQDVDPVARDTVRAYGLSRFQIFRHVSVPSAMPYIATGIRLAATLALIITVGQEFLVGNSGLGYQINEARYASDSPKMYALIVAIGVVGLTLTIGLRRGERRVMHWHASQRVESAP